MSAMCLTACVRPCDAVHYLASGSDDLGPLFVHLARLADGAEAVEFDIEWDRAATYRKRALTEEFRAFILADAQCRLADRAAASAPVGAG